jgi:hypothetical protein
MRTHKETCDDDQAIGGTAQDEIEGSTETYVNH